MKIKFGIMSLLVLVSIFAGGCTDISEKEKPEWIDSFAIEECDFSSSGENRYFILKPGYQLILEGPDEENNSVKLMITVLNVTSTIDGVETRIVEEKETVNGELVEISHNFFSICIQTDDVYYFGEYVDIYDEGEVVSHEGAWKAGTGDARAGIMMPGTIKPGYKYYQEVAPGVAMDRAEILNDDETLQTPAGTFTGVLKIEESTPLEPAEIEYKFHAPGIGLIQDEELLLTGYGYIDLNNFTAYITQHYAEEIALGTAEGTVAQVLTEEKDNKTVYIVRLIHQNITTDVTIDALTGTIVTKEISNYAGEQVPEVKLTEEEAKAIALKAVPGTVTDVAQERKGGKLVYVVEINNNNIETDVVIDIVTGEIINIET